MSRFGLNRQESTVEAKTPILQDKRLFMAIGTILSLIIASVFKVELSPELLASVVTVAVGYITNSALKEKAVAIAIAEAAKAGAAAAGKVPDEKPKSAAELVQE